MNRFQLKILAVVTMLIDHIGAVFFPQAVLLRIIGRLSFPIFAFLISEGLTHTSNIKKYFLRLLLFAFISEVPFDLAFRMSIFNPQSQNIFFTLFFGLAAIYFLKAYLYQNPAIAVLLALSMALLAEFFNTDYGWFGVAAVIVFYCFRKSRIWGAAAFVLLAAAFGLLSSSLEIYAAAAIIPILAYNGEKGRWNWKYFFYLFYPVHLLLIYFIHLVAI
ncbi:MAG TPA: TraX family protein [Caproiciproducens sp.]|nr:TraX family protein [Caproiciproducens sp.]